MAASGLDSALVDIRHEMLTEAVEIIRRLWEGGFVTYHGAHYDVESVRLFDLPPEAPQLGIAASGQESCGIAGQMADLMISTMPKAELVQMFNRLRRAGQARRGSDHRLLGSR